MACAGARAYEGLGAEPPAGVQWWVPPPCGRSGGEADEVFMFKTVIFSGFAVVLHEMMYNLYF